jgi:hypothetical protein
MSDKRGSRGGRRVQRGRRPEQNQPVLPVINPFTRVAQALTEEAAALALSRMIALNPQLQGAHLDDVLDMLDQSDSFVSWADPFWGLRGADLSRELGDNGSEIVSAAFDAAILVCDKLRDVHTSLDPDPAVIAFAEVLARATAADKSETVPAPEDQRTVSEP